MITVATLLWRPNANSQPFSTMYTPEWVDRLYRGFARNLSAPFRFVCFADDDYAFAEPIETIRLRDPKPGYGTCIEPYRLGDPMILVGLDTIVCGAIDHLADYCLSADVIALPRDPYAKHQACNGVALVPGGNAHVYEHWRGMNDMEWMRRQEHVFIDDLFPGQVQSFKGAVKAGGIGDTRICYFHGREKPHELPAGHPLLEHWV